MLLWQHHLACSPKLCNHTFWVQNPNAYTLISGLFKWLTIYAREMWKKKRKEKSNVENNQVLTILSIKKKKFVHNESFYDINCHVRCGIDARLFNLTWPLDAQHHHPPRGPHPKLLKRVTTHNLP